MENEIALQAANNEVMRKIGRNMLLFQQVERLLKHLLARGSFSGNTDTLMANRENRIASINRKTMGQLTGEFFDNTYSGENEKLSVEPVDRAHVSFSFRVECEADHYESQKIIFNELVTERNDLIHHLLPRYNPESLESCQELDRYLEQQRDKLLPTLSNLKAMARSLKEGTKELANFMKSEDGYRLIIEGLLPGESYLDGLLKKVASLSARADGWAPLQIAGRLINEQEPVTINKVCKELGINKLKSLKKLIEASQSFELLEEPTRGSTQWLFRLKGQVSEK